MHAVSDSMREQIRAAFPSLDSGTIFLENAGGSQVPEVVSNRIRTYMRSSYAQLGAGYAESRRASATVADAHAFVATLMNATRGHVILGSSATSLLRMLADCYLDVLAPGSEIVIAETGHEANVGPWTRLERHGLVVRWWRLDPETASCTLEGLEPLLCDRTALVVFPHVSNLVGKIENVQAITGAAHEIGARVVVDGVAYAPHRAMDVASWDVDWYVYSTYKVYGPHMAALYGRADALAALTGPNHFFIPDDEIPYKFELGGPSHEGCAGLLGLGEYLSFLASLAPDAHRGAPGGGDLERGNRADGGGAACAPGCDRETLEAAFALMTACELPPQEAFLRFLSERRGVRIIGPHASDASRVSTISFVHERLSSGEIVEAVERTGIGIRHGHMYAFRLVKALGIDPGDGVVRVSLVHYNTPSEVARLVEVLDHVL